MISQLAALNKAGEELGKIAGVTAMTDVTGFGLLGHLVEMTEGSGLSAEIFYNKIPVAPGVREYISQRIFPDATTRNWNAYSDKVKFEKGINVMEAFTLLPDPQTNGGLLISARPESINEIQAIIGSDMVPIGNMINENEKRIWVK
jgi:selenide,water dikinase